MSARANVEYSQEQLERARQNYRACLARFTSTNRAEVVRGTGLENAPRPADDGILAFDIYFHIETYLQARPRGRCFRPAPPCLLAVDPVTIRVPDVAFIETHRLVAQPWQRLCPIVPDLIAEVISDPARWDEVNARVADFLASGTRIAWILDVPGRRLVTRRQNGEERSFGYHQKVYAAPVLPRLNVHVFELMGE